MILVQSRWAANTFHIKMKTTVEVLARMAKLKGEPAPEYVYDENGLGHQARQKMLDQRDKDWWMEFNDELPEHSAPPNEQKRSKRNEQRDDERENEKTITGKP